MPELANAFDIDEEVTLRMDFTDAEDQPADPSDVEVTVRKPDGTIITLDQPTSEEQGIFFAKVVVDQTGRWWWRAEWTGDRVQVEQSWFFVRYRRVPEPEGS